jgi:hypothetical protein
VCSSISFLSTHPLSTPSFIHFPPFASFVSPVYLLGDPSSFARGANVHPLLSLVSYQLFSPCCLTHPEGTPQIKLHIYIDDINNISRPVWYTYHPTSSPLQMWWHVSILWQVVFYWWGHWISILELKVLYSCGHQVPISKQEVIPLLMCPPCFYFGTGSSVQLWPPESYFETKSHSSTDVSPMFLFWDKEFCTDAVTMF